MNLGGHLGCQAPSTCGSVGKWVANYNVCPGLQLLRARLEPPLAGQTSELIDLSTFLFCSGSSIHLLWNQLQNGSPGGRASDRTSHISPVFFRRYFTNYLTKYKITSGLLQARDSNVRSMMQTGRRIWGTELRVTSHPGCSGQWGLLAASEWETFGVLPWHNPWFIARSQSYIIDHMCQCDAKRGLLEDIA